MAESQWQTIADDLRSQIERGALRPGDLLPSAAELATTWRVSRPTTDRALNELQRTGLITRRRRWGSVVADGTRELKRMIGLVCDYSHGIFQADIMRGVQEGLGEGYALIMCDSLDDHEREAHHLRKMQKETDGILCYSLCAAENQSLYAKLVEAHTPLVFVDRAPSGIESTVITSNNEEITYHSVRKLVERGHRRIAFFSGDNNHVPTVKERYEGYARAMREAGLEQPQPYLRWITKDLEHKPQLLVQTVFDALHALHQLPEPPTAVFCVQDFLASALLEACAQMDLSVPDDLEILTFNDWPPMMLRTPWRVHRIVQNASEMGRLAAIHLLDQINGLECEPQEVRVPAQFLPADVAMLNGPARVIR